MAFKLHRAVESGNIELVKSLIENKADVNETEESLTPLYPAIKKNNLKLVKVLLDNGAKPCFAGYPYLLLAIQQKPTEKHLKTINYQIIELLIDKGANVNEFSNRGENLPLFYALCSPPSIPLAKLLLSNGANIEKYESLLQNAIELDRNSDHAIHEYNIAKLIIIVVLSRHQPNEKLEFLEENTILSDYWDEVKLKLDYLNENPVVGKDQAKRFIKECEFLKDSLVGLSLNAFFKSNVKATRNNISSDANKTLFNIAAA